ncbi:MarR family transcriptional regulator [Streptomyces sp. NPDC057854]|uniref:ArsR/SmtB family transcription factor n=1 Tax=unclassified Streptomyces TaxID=2593676 RepID=UPI003683C1ED
MIRLELDADAVARTRFAVSPLMQAGAALHPHAAVRNGPHRLTGSAVGGVLERRGLHLIAAIRSHVGGYVPDFMTPGHAAGPRPDLMAELHHVATTPTEVVARQLGRMLDHTDHTDRDANGPEPRLAGLRRYVERGEREFSERIAREMHAFWESCLAPAWPALRSRAEADVEARARLAATSGLGTALSSLHPAVTYRTGRLLVAADRRLDVRDAGSLLLFPSPLATSWLLSVDPWRERGVFLIYPAAVRPPARRPSGECGADEALGRLVGRARLPLLMDLATPRTTTELAARHHMAASTVSYHLTRLHRAGLVTRTREAHRVYYERSARASALLDDRADTGGTGETEPRAGVVSA